MGPPGSGNLSGKTKGGSGEGNPPKAKKK
jgi:hypothetical protein